ncbi:DUF6236 family protein [uncultured Zhongshania sp.]|uniref:DUF6236 family protein n=1 Tax=uncultured Zhongshania sp. TaxID=1642288 RepID=UPI0025CC6B72|nr:DUF6236 family protein [uncultured Zhongshania sp.]
MKRGIIASPAEVKLLMNGFNIASSISAAELRFYLLYWNKVFIPTNNLIHIGVPDEDLLISSGAIFRPRVALNGSFSGHEAGAAILNSQCEIAKFMSKDATTSWTFQQRGETQVLPQEFSNSRDILKIDLANILLSPSSDVEIYDVLEFKERHADQLATLHEMLDALYLEILSSADPDVKKIAVLSDLAKLINDHNKSIRKRFVSSQSFDLSAEINIKGNDALKGAFCLGALNSVIDLGMTSLAAAVIGGLASTISLSAKVGKTFKYQQPSTQLVYLSQARKEGIL